MLLFFENMRLKYALKIKKNMLFKMLKLISIYYLYILNYSNTKIITIILINMNKIVYLL